MVQPNSQYGNSIYFPYAAGSLIAYALRDNTISNNYTFEGFIYKKENIDTVIERIDNPSVVAFSCYVWNYEYNKKLAERIKTVYPECIIIFGGHQIYRHSDALGYDYIDCYIFGEGEEAFRRVLLGYLDIEDLNEIPNLAYRKNENLLFTATKRIDIPERVSPYLDGYFDDLIENEKKLVFSAILETNRGCPNKCAFCDWGNEKARVKNYSSEIVKAEIDWMSEKEIEYCYCADANFGLFERDKDFVEYLIKKNSANGYPQKFQATYSKNNAETVFEINKRLNESEMSKGATLSFQSMHQNVLDKIYRKNMPIENFHKLMSLYTANGIATYSELILGLPGETYDSFADGIEQLLECGQHMSINFFNCELLSNSIMNNEEYIRNHGIEYVSTEQHQYHIVPNETDIIEFSRIVVSTNTMSKEDWIKCNILSVFVRAFHNLGLLQCIAIYLYYENKIKYIDFYSDMINWAKGNKDSICGSIYYWLIEKYEQVLSNSGSLTCVVGEYGKLTWPLDEGAFLKIVLQYNDFYKEIEPFIKKYINDTDVLDDLMVYQKSIIKNPYSKGCSLQQRFDFYNYFLHIYENDYIKLENKKNLIHIDSSDTPENLEKYAEKVIWYGRKGGQNIIKKVDCTVCEE